MTGPDTPAPQRIPPQRRSAGRRVTPERLEAILDAAEELILTDGFSAVTMQAIATHTGYVRPVIYDCYGTAENVIVRLVARSMRALRAEIDTLTIETDRAAHAGQNTITAALRALTDSAYTHPRLWRMAEIPAVNAPDDARHDIADARSAIRAVIRTALCRELGPHLQQSTDTDALAFLLQGIIEAFVSRICTQPETYPRERVQSFIESIAAGTHFTS